MNDEYQKQDFKRGNGQKFRTKRGLGGLVIKTTKKSKRRSRRQTQVKSYKENEKARDRVGDTP